MDFLEIDNIELNFDKAEILKAIYLKAEKGKVTGILGSNGSGKTSLLRIIFGELKPNNKLLRIDNKPKLTPFYKSGNIKYLPQFNIVPKSISLKLAFTTFNVSFEEFTINFPNFKKQENFHFSEFSGGEKRVIETYITLKSPSKVVLLDEPFSHIAPLYIQKLKELIEIEKRNKIFIITDHLYNHILDISDDIYLLKDGWSKIIKSPDELIHHKYLSTL